MDPIVVIAADKELRKLLYEAFKWVGHPASLDHRMTDLRKRLLEKYGLDIEQYT